MLRALFNFAAGEYEDEHGAPLFADNPVTRLTHTQAWYRVERRRTVIKTDEIKPWFEAVLSLESEHREQADTVRDYLLLLLFTGYAVKRLVNHKLSADVTASYIASNVERLRAPMQKITDFILSAADIRPRGEVIPLDVSRGTSIERKP